MPHPHPRARWHPSPAPTRAQVAAALLFAAPTAAAQARVEAVVEGWEEPAAVDAARSARARASDRAGRDAENATARLLRGAGYAVTRSQGSQGAADFVAVGPEGVRLIQCKAVSVYTPGCANAAVRELTGRGGFKALALSAGVVAEAWVFMRGMWDAPLVVVRIDHHGTVTATGEPSAAVLAAVNKMLSKHKE